MAWFYVKVILGGAGALVFILCAVTQLRRN